MKCLLTLFVCFLMINSFFSLSISNKLRIPDNNFSSRNTLETGDDGIMVNIDSSNVFRERVNFKNKLSTYIVSSTEIGFSDFDYSINVGENNRSLSRLQIVYHLVGINFSWNTGDISQITAHNMGIKLYFDDVMIGYIFHGGHYSNRDYFSLVLKGTVFNVAPGVHTIKMRGNTDYKFIFGNYGNSMQDSLNGLSQVYGYGSHLHYSFLDLFGEFLDSSDENPVSRSFLIPVNPRTRIMRKAKLALSIDDDVRYMRINGINHPMYLYFSQGEVNNCWVSKSFESLLGDQDTITLYGVDSHGGSRGIIGNFVYYNSLGFPEIINTNASDWKCEGATPVVQARDVESTTNLRPIDFGADWIWSTAGVSSGATCTVTLPQTVTKSVIYVSMCTQLEEIRVNGGSPISVASGNPGLCQRTKKIISDATGSLKSGDVVSFKGSKVANTSSNISNSYFNLNSLAAVIAYKNSNGDVVQVTTNDNLYWICDDVVPSVVNMDSGFRNQYFLNNAFSINSIYRASGNITTICKITLP